jgi:hypothetical protein
VALGDEVYGLNDWFADGATAEFYLTRPEWIAPETSQLDANRSRLFTDQHLNGMAGII